MVEHAEFPETPNRQDPQGPASTDYLTSAAEACASGDMVLGMHLYLAAYEKAASDPGVPDALAQRSLREAWHLACDLKERAMAEYIFEKLEPYLTSDEVSECAEQLQRLALDRLAEFGLSADDLDDMADMISQDILGNDGSVVHVEHIGTIPLRASGAQAEDGTAPRQVDVSAAAFDFSMATQEFDSASTPTIAEGEAPVQESTQETPVDNAAPKTISPAEAVAQSNANAPAPNMPKFDISLPAMTPPPGVPANGPVPGVREPLSYRTLVGYDEAINVMRDFGVGMQNDPAFLDFVGLLNYRHGLDRMPALDSILFRAPVREDAIRFVEATIGEIGLPALRMSMEENVQGMPVLCVTTQSDNHPRLNRANNRFVAPAILVIEDLDMWSLPVIPDNAEGFNGFMMANISRGIRDAIDMIRASVEDPDVYVLATSSVNGEVDPYFYDILEPLSVIDIGYPSDRERSDIWNELVRDHPSMRTLNRVDLMRYSQGMARYDIYMAAREAVEEAYKAGLISRTYKPVSAQNIFEKLAAFQPLESAEYLALEDKVVNDFKSDLEHLEDLIDGSWD